MTPFAILTVLCLVLVLVGVAVHYSRPSAGFGIAMTGVVLHLLLVLLGRGS